MRLTDAAGGTELSYRVEARVGGKLAQLGNRVITPFASRLSEEFFERFRQQVEGGAPS